MQHKFSDFENRSCSQIIQFQLKWCFPRRAAGVTFVLQIILPFTAFGFLIESLQFFVHSQQLPISFTFHFYTDALSHIYFIVVVHTYFK